MIFTQIPTFLRTESSHNFSVQSYNRNNIMESQLTLGNDKLTAHGNNFHVTDTHGITLFAADQKEVHFGTNSLRIDGMGGSIIRESIHTPLIRADVGKTLR